GSAPHFGGAVGGAGIWGGLPVRGVGRARWGQGTGVCGGILQHIICCGHAAGGTAGSARTRSRVQTLENPFWGNRRLGSRGPITTAAGGRPLPVGLPSLIPAYTPSGTRKKHQ